MSTTTHDHARHVSLHGARTEIKIPADILSEDPYLEMLVGHTVAEFREALEVLDVFGFSLFEVDEVMPELIGADRIRWFAVLKE